MTQFRPAHHMVNKSFLLVAHQPLLVSDNKGDCPFAWHQNIRSVLFGFVTKHACDRQADRRTDRQIDTLNYCLFPQFNKQQAICQCNNKYQTAIEMKVTCYNNHTNNFASTLVPKYCRWWISSTNFICNKVTFGTFTPLFCVVLWNLTVTVTCLLLYFKIML